jgi:hypothetical protein
MLVNIPEYHRLALSTDLGDEDFIWYFPVVHGVKTERQSGISA